MRNSERLAEIRKKRDEEEKKSSSSATTTKSYRNSDRLKGSRLKNTIDFDTFESDLSSMGKTIGDITGGWQTKETMINTKVAIESMQGRINAYQEYRKLYAPSLPDLSDLSKGYSEVLSGWDERTKTYGKYKDASSYTKAMKDAEEYLKIEEGKKTANLNDVQNEIDVLQKKYETAVGLKNKIETAKNKTNTRGYKESVYRGALDDDYTTGIKNAEKEYEEFLKASGFSSVDEIKAQLEGKKQYKNSAEYIQGGITLEKNIRSDANFSDYVAKGAALPDNKVAELRNNPETMETYEEAAKSANGASFGTVERILKNQGTYKLAKYGTKEQVENYYAYLGKGDKENAEKYLKSIEESLNIAMGTEIASEKDNLGKKLLFSVPSGLDQFEQGVINLFNFTDKYIPTSPTQVASGQVRESLDDVGFDILGNSLGQTIYDFGTTTSNMAPSIATSYLANAILPGSGTVVGSALMGGSAAGNSYQEKLNLGWDKSQARVYSSIVGISEGALQYALGGIGSLGGKISGKSAQAIARGIDNAAGRFAVTLGMNMASEGLEEGLQEVLTPFFENLALGYNKNDLSEVEWEQVAYSGMLGALSALGLEGGSTAVNTFRENRISKEIGADIRSGEQIGEVLDVAKLTPQESAAYELYTQYANRGVTAENASDLQLGRLYVNAEADARATLSERNVKPVQAMSAMETLHKLDVVKNKSAEAKQIADRVAEMNTGEVTEETSTGNSFTIEGIKIGEEDTTLVTSEGEMSLNDVTLSETDAELVAYAEGMDEKIANLFIAQYDGESSVSDYASSFNLVADYARLNFTQDVILEHKGVLTEKQVGAIYAETVKASFEEQQNAVNRLSEKYGAKLSVKGTFDDSVIDRTNKTTDGSKVNWSDLTPSQRKAVTFAKLFSKATGVNVKFIKSEVEDGKHQGENGSYNPETNTIEIDVFAGRIDATALNDSIIPTLSHEITHWAKYKAPAIYNALREEIMGTLSDVSDWTTSDRVVAEMNRLKANHPDMNVTPEAAIDEIVARACEDMLSNSSEARKLLAKMSASEQQDFIGKVKETFNNLMQWVNDLLSQYKSESEEAKLLREYKHNLKKVSKMWDEMLVSAVESNKALQKEGITGEALANKVAEVGLQYDTESESFAPTIQLSERTWTASEYVQNREVAINAIVKALDISEKDAARYIDNINSIAKAIADDRSRLDYDENVDENASALKSNKEYKWTVDMSTLCAKRLLFTGTFDAIQKAMPNTAFTSEDIVALRSMMMERGYEVACGICYVESTRRELGTITAEFIERYKASQESGKPITKFNSKGKEVVIQEAETQRQFIADKNYTPTLAELNTTDIDKVKVEHPDVYAAYLSFMKSRGQATPKLLETRTEYKGEILKHFKDKKAVKSRNDAGGLRVQSFSDFEIAHLIDMMQVVLDMSRVGLMSQAYTKVPEFADVFGNTGMKINLSLIAKGSGLDANGNLIFDDVEGMPHGKAFELREKYSKNVGTILVGKNDAHIIAAMADSRIDYIIPFHKSFWKESLYEALGLQGYSDYTDTQNEKPIDKSRKIKNFEPSEYWDYSKTGDENAQIYLEKCKEDGRIPKFPQFQSYPGYWKLLIDFKMYDNEGVGSPQEVVRPEFSMDEANKILNSYEGGHRSFPVANDVVDDFVKQYEDKKQYSDREVIDIPFDMYSTMESHFGTTKNFDVAGYLLRDGKMLDFSGKHWGATDSDYRQVDHRDIQEVLEDNDNGVTAMVSMISNGNIRLMPEVGGINLSQEPNGFQSRVLRDYINHFNGEVIIDIDEVGGDTIHSFEYSKGTSASKVISDLEGYFRRGEIPSRTKTSIAEFRYSDRDNGDRNFSYNELVAKDDLKGIVIGKNQQVKLMSNGSINAEWVVSEVKKKCKKLTTKAKEPTYYTEVPDIGRNVEISNKGITHAFFDSVGNTKKASPRDLINARVSLELPNVLKHSVEVNRSVRGNNIDVPYSHVMMGTVALQDANGNLEYYAVRSVIEERVNQNPILVEAEVLGKLRAINAKKIGTPNAQVTKNGVALTYDVAYTYKIAQFLEDVKVEFDDTFSEDVYSRLGMTRNQSDFSKNLLFSDRQTETIYDKMGETERIKKENEILKADVERLVERLKLESQVTKGDRYDKRKLEMVAGHLRNIAKSTTANETLVPMLEEAFGYMARLDDVDAYNGTMRRLNQIAEALLEEAKPETVSDAYAKLILRDIREKRISLSESQIAEAKRIFGDNYRNAFWGKVVIAKDGISLDSQWQEWENRYPAYFDANVNEGDQIGALYDIYNGLKDLSEMAVEYDKAEMTRWLGQEVLNSFWNLKPIETITDKYEKRIKEINFEHRKTMDELRESRDKLLEQQNLELRWLSAKKLHEVRTHRDELLKQQRKELGKKTAERLNELRDRKDREIAEVKKLGKERMDEYKENAERKTVIQRITGNALTLNKWLTKNSKDYHIHKAMQGPVIKLLQAIDFSSKRMLKKGDPTQKDVSFAEGFAEVRAMLADADNMVEGLEALYGHDLAEQIDLLSKATYRLVGDNNYIINAMSNEELQSLDKLVRHIKKVVSELNKFHTVHHSQGAVNLANEFMVHGEKIGNLKKQHGKIAKALEFRNKTPYYFFKHLGEAGKKIFEAFQDGWDKLAFNAKKIIDFAEETYTAKEVKQWSKETKTFKVKQLDGSERTFEMSIAQIMALHCVSKQDDAKTHLLSGGMTLKRLDKKGHVVADYENINLSISDIQTILESLTDRQREVADKLQEFMNTVCSAWGNEISMARFGIEMFGLPDYFPIKVSEATVPTDNTKDIDNASLFRLLNMSFTKSRNQYADQSIEIGDIFDIFAQHSSDMAKYNALALPVLDFNKFYSIHGKDALGKEYGVVKTLKSVFGDEANGYLRRFVRDINGSQNVSRDVIGNTFFKNAKVASVANNLRVVLLQPTAFYKASAVLDNKYLLKASAYMKVEPIMMYNRFKKAAEKAEKYCGIVQWKALGYYDTDISKGLTEKIKHADTFKDKAVEKSLKLAEIADKATFATLWTACEFEIRDTRKDLSVGSKEYYDAVAERLRDVIYATQVVDSTMTRSDMMRSSDRMDKMLTTFGSEPIVAYNMLLDVVTQYNRDTKEFGKKEAKKRNFKKTRKVIAAYVMTNAMAALIESGFDVLRDDDDEEMDMAVFMKDYLKNFAFDMSIGNKLPVIKEAYSIMQGYSSSRMDTQWLGYLKKIFDITRKIAEGKGEGKGDDFVKYLLKFGSDLSGYAFYNAYRDIMAALNKLDIFTTEDLNEFFDGFFE